MHLLHAGVFQIANYNLLNPSDSVEAPRTQVRRHSLLDPSALAVSVDGLPEVAGVGVPEGGGIDVIHADRPKRSFLRSDEPPVAASLLHCEKG
jgi:hypothetical protein